MRSEETRRYFEGYTKKERVKNWFYYYKWWLLLGVVLAASAGRLIYQNVTRIVPDYQAAYVGEYPLSEERAAGIEALLAGFGEDLNGDGRVVVRLNQYPKITNGDAAMSVSNAAWETRLMGDLVAGESYLFLLSDPAGFEADYDVLEPGAVDASALGEELGGLTLARRAYAEGKEPGDIRGFEALWARLTA